MQKVYVIGGSGFIGQNLRVTLSDAGYDVQIIDSASDSGPIQSYDKVFSQGSIVIHLASRSQHTQKIWRALDDLEAFISTLNRAEPNNVPVYVASTAEVSGGTGPYACFCRSMEVFSSAYRKAVKVGFLRIHSVYGRGQHDNLIHRALSRAGSDTELSIYGGTQIRDWIHVSDVCSAITHLVRNYFANGKIVNCQIGTGRGIPVLGLVDMITRQVIQDYRLNVRTYSMAIEPLVSVAQRLPLGWKPSITLESGLQQLFTHYNDKH